MADQIFRRIDQLSQASSINPATDLIALSQSSVTKKATIDQVAAGINTSLYLSELGDVDQSVAPSDGVTLSWDNVLQKFVYVDINTIAVGPHSILNTVAHTDVNPTTLVAGQTLSYQSGKWTNTSISNLLASKYQNIVSVASGFGTKVLTEDDTNTCFISNKTTGSQVFVLPPSSNTLSGTIFTFTKPSNSTSVSAITISANTGCIIAGSTTNGVVSTDTSAEVGANISLASINNSAWIITSSYGTWATA